jgi:hypothetical protein
MELVAAIARLQSDIDPGHMEACLLKAASGAAGTAEKIKGARLHDGRSRLQLGQIPKSVDGSGLQV